MRDDRTAVYCMRCGVPIPPWFADGQTPDEEDAAYTHWLDTPCAS